LHERRETQKELTWEELGREALDGYDAGEQEKSGGRQSDPVRKNAADNAGYSAVLGKKNQGIDDAANNIEGEDNDADGGEERGGFSHEERAGADGQRREDEDVATVWIDGVPGEHGKQAHDHHRGRDQKVFNRPGAWRWYAGESSEHQWRGNHDTEGGKHSGELLNKFCSVGIGGKEFEIDHAQEKYVIEHAKLKRQKTREVTHE
jgi:hypothetical protein